MTWSVTVALFGREIARLDLGPPEPVEMPGHPDLAAVNRHSGDFGFGTSPARPYWSHDYDGAPAVATARRAP